MTHAARRRADRISAWLDGALNEADLAALEAEAATDPSLAAEMAAMQAQDANLRVAFDALLEAPVPDALTHAALTAPPRTLRPANTTTAPLRWSAAIAAALVLILIGGGGGAYLTRAYFPTTEVVEVQPGWMAQVASYHRVYARQARHLAEVPASEKDHIEAWLSKETGVAFTVPDLGAAGFEFEGGRLLVAAEKPVLQLMYRNTDGAVLALCALQSSREAEGFETRRFGDDLTMVRWAEPGADWIAVGTPEIDVAGAAELASAEI